MRQKVYENALMHFHIYIEKMIIICLMLFSNKIYTRQVAYFLPSFGVLFHIVQFFVLEL